MSVDIGMAAVTSVLSLGSIAMMKVLRPSEHEVMAMAFPERWRPALALIRIVAGA
jgi:hypothetical protein